MEAALTLLNISIIAAFTLAGVFIVLPMVSAFLRWRANRAADSGEVAANRRAQLLNAIIEKPLCAQVGPIDALPLETDEEWAARMIHTFFHPGYFGAVALYAKPAAGTDLAAVPSDVHILANSIIEGLRMRHSPQPDAVVTKTRASRKAKAQ